MVSEPVVCSPGGASHLNPMNGTPWKPAAHSLQTIQGGSILTVSCILLLLSSRVQTVDLYFKAVVLNQGSVLHLRTFDKLVFTTSSLLLAFMDRVQGYC